MAWTAGRTWAVGETLTAANLNTFLRDNMKVGRRFNSGGSFAGNYTLNNTNWTNLDNTAFDVTFTLVNGDVVEACMMAFWGSEAIGCALDVKCTASGNYFGGAIDPATGDGIGAWYGVNGQNTSTGGAHYRTMSSTDVGSTFRVRYKTAGAVNKTLLATLNDPCYLFYRNRGPAV